MIYVFAVVFIVVCVASVCYNKGVKHHSKRID